MYKCRLILLFYSKKYTRFEDSAQIGDPYLDVRLVCDPENHNVLTISGFDSEVEAIDYLKTLRVAFHWLMLDQEIVVDASLEPEGIQRHSNVKDGCNFSSMNGRAATHIYERDSSYIHTTNIGGDSILGASIVLECIQRGLAFAARISPEIDERLSTSLGLYRSSILQENQSARFTMLISSMECLTNMESRDAWQIAMLDKFITEVKEYGVEQDVPFSNEELKAKKDSFISGLLGLKSKPKKQLVLQELKQIYDDPEEFKIIKQVIKASFGKRNSVLHEGKSVSLEEVERLARIQRDLLMHRITSLPNRKLLEDEAESAI